jgi:hypothetical protein
MLVNLSGMLRFHAALVGVALVGCGPSSGGAGDEAPSDAGAEADATVSADAGGATDGAAGSDATPSDAAPADAPSLDDAPGDALRDAPPDDGGPTWAPEQPYTLNLPGTPPPVTLDLGRPGINAVLPASEQRGVVVLSLDPTPFLTSTLGGMKNACGTGWQIDQPDPGYDCTATALGQTFVGPDGTWKSSPELALIRLITETPANSVVDGTSVQSLKDIANALSIGGGYQQILADTLGIARTRELVTLPNLVNVLRTRFMATHPAMPATGFIPITFYETMNDLTPLAATLGPASPHAGILDPAVSTTTTVFGPAFKLSLSGPSNVWTFQGVVLGTGAGNLASIVDTTGPTYDDPAELDFTTLTASGLIASPTVDLRVKIYENPAYVSACSTSDTACVNGAAVWGTPKWQAENLVAYDAFGQYGARASYDDCYFMCSFEVKVGYGGALAGWAQFSAIFGIGNPPHSQFLSEMLMELGEVALHRVSVSGQTTYLAEGQANPAFTMRAVPVGTTPSALATAIRPTLAAHASALDVSAAGAWSAGNANVDFYLRAGEDGTVELWFPAASDARPGPYAYPHVGFFGDAALTAKVSATSIPGTTDTAHEKLALTPGTSVVYAGDGSGSTWRLTIGYVAGATSATVNVAKKL